MGNVNRMVVEKPVRRPTPATSFLLRGKSGTNLQRVTVSLDSSAPEPYGYCSGASASVFLPSGDFDELSRQVFDGGCETTVLVQCKGDDVVHDDESDVDGFDCSSDTREMRYIAAIAGSMERTEQRLEIDVSKKLVSDVRAIRDGIDSLLRLAEERLLRSAAE